MDTTYICVVCDRTFTRPRTPGNFVQIRKLCDDCLQHHKWCQYGRHAPLHSKFSPNRLHGGWQTICNDCLPDRRGSNRIATCFACNEDFIIWGGRGRHNGATITLCDDCHQVVKFCRQCKTIRPREEFSRRSDTPDGRTAHCVYCHKSKWDNATEEQRHHAPHKYGLTRAEYLQILEGQNGICAICHQPETSKRRNGTPLPLHIDHDHDTSQVRMLLCGNCNKGLGCFADSPERLRAAADYLEKFKPATVH